jgi:hypothetical protein
MPRPIRIAGQVIVYGAFAALIGTFSNGPVHRHFAADAAQIKLSFNHAAARRSDCRQRSAEEIAALAPNMRRPMDCGRERVDLLVELDIDGQNVFQSAVPPTGIARDGETAVYEKFTVAAGEHDIRVRLRDSRRETGFDYDASTTAVLAPRQNFVIDFDHTLGGFQFRGTGD